MRRLLLLGLCLPILIAGAAPDRWARARDAYDAGNHREARDLYLALRADEGTSAALEYNLGNVFMRLEDPARALAHYRRAQWLAPGDPDVRANLARAAEETGGEVPTLPAWRRMSGFLPPAAWRTTLIAACWLLAAAGLGRRRFPLLRRGAPWILPALGAFALLAAGGVWAGRPEPMESEAVLRGDEVTARFEPLPDATAHFSLPGGSVVRVTGERRDWLRIEADGASGWVRRTDALRLAEI